MKHKIILKNGKYYRINSDDTQTEVLFKDGYFYWTNPKGTKVRAGVNDVEMPKSLMSRLGEIFTNISISAANADTPAVTTASGWRRKGNSWNQDEAESQTSLQLRKNLAALSTMAYAPAASATAKLVAPGTVGGNAIGTAAGTTAIGSSLEEAERAVSGQSLGDMASSKLQEAGIWPVIADMARLEYYFDPTGLVARTFLSALSTPVRQGSKLVTKPRKIKGVERTPIVESPTTEVPVSSENSLDNIFQNASSNNLETTLSRLRGESINPTLEVLPASLLTPEVSSSVPRTSPTSQSIPVTQSVDQSVPAWQASADILRRHHYTETSPGVFNYWSNTYDLTTENPRQWVIRNNLLEELDLLDPNNVLDIVNYRVKTIPLEAAEAYLKYPYLLLYRKIGEPYTIDNIPGLDRTDLVEGGMGYSGDVTHMSHLAGEQIFDNEGHLIGNKVNGEGSYTDVMANELNKVPHGASVGFNSDRATSTSSTPMFFMLLNRMLSNGRIARVYSPQNNPRYQLNSLGRAYILDKKGRMKPIVGTEGHSFNIPYKPEYLGVKNVKHTLADGSLREVILLPDGNYLSDIYDSTNDINNAMNGYYNNGMIYSIRPIGKHKVIAAVDLPTLTREQYVELLNKHYISPLAKRAGLNIEPAKVVNNRIIEVPSIAAIAFKEGGLIQRFRKNRKCKKN